MNNWLNINLFSGACLLCGLPAQINTPMCRDCRNSLPTNTTCCCRCALPIKIDPVRLANESAKHNLYCGRCLQDPPPFFQSHIPYHYATPLINLLTGLKFSQQLHHARLLGNLLTQHLLPQLTSKPECIIPVPLHPQRLRQRGYNQALELARPAAQALNIKLDTQLCQRIKNTQPQTELSLRSRHANLRNAFQIAATVPYQHIAIIDDIVTTGHTVHELARMFKRAGVAQIEIWAIARA
ncbi:MAG: ComF family protein [Gammaproteobacteria bacterium]|nr:ComF family protein [Gammaproteobacteria bacterium]